MAVKTKICGLSTREAVDTALDYGAAYLGFVFFSRSPRHITPLQAASLAHPVPTGVKKVAVTVDMADDELSSLLHTFTPDYLQLHGKESPERVNHLRSAYGIPIIKALSIESKEDLTAAQAYTLYADMLLFDAKPPKGAALPGGNGVAFEWEILRKASLTLSWFLSGGLSCQNVAEAVNISNASMVDVSSGVESSPGVKDIGRIAEFLTITNALL